VWLSIAYLLASVAYNAWKFSPLFYATPTSGDVAPGINILCKFAGAACLLFGRKQAVYPLIVVFLEGAAATILPMVENYRSGMALHLSVSAIAGLSATLAIIVYVVDLTKRHILR